MSIFKHFLLIAALMCGFSSYNVLADHTSQQSTVVASDEIKWGYLNPLRGNKSPGAADLWGNRTEDVATGMLVKFNKNFASPPHTHNISYRGIVIKGMMHNDDPNAEKMWMPEGSFWTQPAGENHITAANSEENQIYLEIDSGPYLVKPSGQHFDNGERPINLHSSNIVWLDQSSLNAIDAEGVKRTALWGRDEPGEMNGTMLKLPYNFEGNITSDANEFRVVVISGNIDYKNAELSSKKALDAGSYVSSKGAFQHNIHANSDDVMLYIRTNGQYRVQSK